MKKPKIRKANPTIDFNDFMEELCEEKGYDYRDMTDRWSNEWRKECLEHVSALCGLDPKNDKWLNDSINRTEAEKKAWEAWQIKHDERPYQDVWHWLLKYPFNDLNRGGDNYLSIDWLNNKPAWYDGEWLESDPRTIPNPDYVERVLQDIFEACKDSEAFDGESICFHIDW